MKSASAKIDAGQRREYCRLAVDASLTITAEELGPWVGELGLDNIQSLVEAPGFPAPTDGTAHLPLDQRRWQMVYALLFMLRANGIDVRVEGELAGNDPALAGMIRLSEKH